jgi:hypothetical protein
LLKRLLNNIRSIVCIALLALGAGLPLMSVNANAGSIPLAAHLIDYTSDGGEYPYIGLLPGWSWRWYSPIWTKVFIDSDAKDNALGIFDYATVVCALQCDDGNRNFLSRQVDGLVTGKQYKLSFWAKGFWQDDLGEGSLKTFGGTKVSASVGSYKSADIDLLPPIVNGQVFSSWNWQKITLNFTHKDASPSAVLSIIQNIVGKTTVGCAPCGAELWFGGIALDNVTQAAPSLTVTKALNGNRGTNTDQFQVQILDGVKVVNSTTNSTTTGSGLTVDNGTGTTGPTTLVAGTSYMITEAGSGATNLGGYSSTLACINSTGTKVPTALNTAFTLSNTDTVSCTITNKALPATLALRQLVLRPVPINIVAPYTFSYTGNNGWTTQPVTNVSEGTLASGPTQTLSAFNTATTLSAIMPDRWSVSTFSCADINAAVSGNPTGTLVIVNKVNTLTIPAANVRPGANLRCTSMLSRLTP